MQNISQITTRQVSLKAIPTLVLRISRALSNVGGGQRANVGGGISRREVCGIQCRSKGKCGQNVGQRAKCGELNVRVQTHKVRRKCKV
ncbi:hypothetical protein LS68_004555 [Helicobacter sp. MIT 05-5293]|uniref:hypothetical protein n=1 Tax=unclassified Helicobacter TaxID=2593540 RepID=UPI0010FDEEE3|nr:MULTISPECIES: hypothetical protein [unclassified Helicobacter]TLD82266.1 hypothetical protein LS68_004555 [Helicobacter sp. MIT 05-5293]TLD85537.1 hypothetical protein LS69_009095 [Helicobacter sp. MIT 05-5294]